MCQREWERNSECLDRRFCASLPTLCFATVFFWPVPPCVPGPIVTRFLGSDRKNWIVDTSDQGFMTSLCVTGWGNLVIRKRPWCHCCSFTLAETAKVVQDAPRGLAKSSRKCSKCSKNIFYFIIKEKKLFHHINSWLLLLYSSRSYQLDVTFT